MIADAGAATPGHKDTEMITSLRIQGYRSWADSGDVRIAPLTVVFGANSAGKSALVDFIRMLRQTAWATDPRALSLPEGDSMGEIVHGEATTGSLTFRVCWTNDTDAAGGQAAPQRPTCLRARIEIASGSAQLAEFTYETRDRSGQAVEVGMEADPAGANRYRMFERDAALQFRERPELAHLPRPPKFYLWPTEAFYSYGGLEDYAGLPLTFERMLRDVAFVGPVRADPMDVYRGVGEARVTVGERGEAAVQALAVAGAEVEADVANWLRAMGLISELHVEPIQGNDSHVRIRVRSVPGAPLVGLADVGFGVGQVLPILVQCRIAPRGSTVLLSHPEAHLHSAAQARLADVVAAAVRERGIQVVVESHSEHFLHRLQRLIAEAEGDTSAGIAAENVALYFAHLGDHGASVLDAVRTDRFGNIENWPPGLFADPMDDLLFVTRTTAEAEQAVS